MLQDLPELPRGEMEAGGDDGEQPEGDDLQGDTNHGDVSAPVQLVLGVLIGRLRPGDHDGADELEQERDHIEADEDRGDPAGGHPEELGGSVLRRDNEEHNSSEDDVDDTGHQDRGENDETELRNVEVLVGRVTGRLDSRSITACLHCCLSAIRSSQEHRTGETYWQRQLS